MTTTTFSTTATPMVARPLSIASMTPNTPMPTGTGTASAWRERVTGGVVTTVVTDTARIAAHHNSIATPAAAVPGANAPVGLGHATGVDAAVFATAAFGTAKQAAPPRGNPR